MNLLVTYDISTETKPGRRRLQKMAVICKSYGQRVQNSVFECTLNDTRMEQMRARLLDNINEKEDNLRIYRLAADRESCVESYGIDKYTDFSEPMVV